MSDPIQPPANVRSFFLPAVVTETGRVVARQHANGVWSLPVVEIPSGHSIRNAMKQFFTDTFKDALSIEDFEGNILQGHIRFLYDETGGTRIYMHPYHFRNADSQKIALIDDPTLGLIKLSDAFTMANFDELHTDILDDLMSQAMGGS